MEDSCAGQTKDHKCRQGNLRRMGRNLSATPCYSKPACLSQRTGCPLPPPGSSVWETERGIITEHLKMGNVSKHSQSRDFYLAIKQKMQKCECCRGLHQIVTCLHCHMECVATS